MRVIILLSLLLLSACTGQAVNSIGTPLTCSDSDGGLVFDTPGTVFTTSSTGAKTKDSDVCQGKRLIEYYCDERNYPSSEVTICNCMKGACV